MMTTLKTKIMSNEEITALTREYAEEMIKGKPSEELPNCLKNSMLTMNTEYVAEIFQWLTHRYALVEKEAVRKQFESAKKLIESRDYNKQCIGVGSRGVLERLFPEIAKEVEG